VAGSPWRPLKNRLFRTLLVANLVSDIGAFMQGVGAAWLMVSLHAGPFYVALIQTASTLPFFLLVLPAGALGDIADRRRIVLIAEYWMLAAALLLAVATFLGMVTPWLLLALTFVLSAGDACEAPAWRAFLPELVGLEDLPAASALNGIEFNLARAVGPALAGLLVAWAGAGTAFLVNAVSFLGVIVVVARWRRPAQARSGPAETLGGATVAALRYVRHSPEIRTLLLWTGCVMFFASAILALLPTVAHRLSGGSLGYGFLLAFFGSGAVLGAILLPRLRVLSPASLLSAALAVLSITLVAAGVLRAIWVLCGFMALGGSAWMIFISNVNTMVQRLAPSWVRARVLSVFLLVFQGSVALGSVVWGLAAEHRGIALALLVAGAGTAASIILRFFADLPRIDDLDLSPWIRGKTPRLVMPADYDPEDGPVLVAVEYRVDASRTAFFLEAVQRLGRLRRRDGASRWGIFRDTEEPDRYVETFIVASWAEHLRQHERSVRADKPVREAVVGSAREVPVVHHFVYARPRR
jgi:MFS family permease